MLGGSDPPPPPTITEGLSSTVTRLAPGRSEQRVRNPQPSLLSKNTAAVLPCPPVQPILKAQPTFALGLPRQP